ncbi:hypothetical protein HYH68_16345 [Clostridium botulinum]|uniref:DUF5592 family protein n=1 Tax=Clostridium botulinum TaxID=1491 RepID=UPI001C9B8E38|nr:DUF5592 family protein [Clostridium botulinum]MBY6889363.1 hypothetical protein [Clostridium botulinum]HDI3019245.1 hypothetical protein [Clostridium botulinum]
MYRNPKNIKQEIKLFFFYLLDLGIIAASVVASVYVAKLLPISAGIKLLFYIVAFCFGVWLCIRTSAHPKERNLAILYHLIKMDRNRYHDIEFTRNKRGKIEL